MADKTSLRCMDYRNAKFQGSIRDNLMDGIGIIFDNQFMLSLTNWKNEMPYGHSLIIFPNRNYIYGRIKNKQLQQVCSYVTSSGETLYFNFINGHSQNIAYVDSNQAIIEITYRNQKLNVVKSHPKQSDQNNKWRIISDILKTGIREQYQDYKKYVKGMIQNQFQDIIQCSENASLTFVGFKNTASLGVKFDKNNKVRQIGNFQEFPRTIQYGRKITDLKNSSAKIQQGKFTSPQSVYSFKGENRSPQAVKQTENYFKKGTNFQNQFIRLNFFIQLSKYLSSIKSQVQDLKVFQFGQSILEKDHQTVDLKQGPSATKQYDLQQVKKDIYTAANRRNKGTTRSPHRQFDNFYESSPLSSSRNRSKDKYQYAQQIKPYEKSKDKYHYVEEALNPKIPKNTQNVYKYHHVPSVSEFDQGISPYARNRQAERIMLQEKRAYNNILQQQILRQKALLMKKYQDLHYTPPSPIHRINEPPIRDRSPYRLVAQRNLDDRADKSPFKPTQSKYQNYVQYKNRKKSNQQPQQQPPKYKIYDRKVLAPNNVSPQKKNEQKSTNKQIAYKNTDRQGVRYKKHYKYVE